LEKEEVRDLTISAIVLALAFSIMFSGGLGWDVFSLFPVSLITISAGFISHELAHRYTARSFGCFAEYRAWPLGLLLALLFSPLGFVFAAPGAVMIRPRADLWGREVWLERREYGLISLAGPLANISLAAALLLLHLRFPSAISSIGGGINAWLAFFNLLPIPPLDGSKVFSWSKAIWAGAILVAAALLFLK
jgi:Zn-dependent protease